MQYEIINDRGQVDPHTHPGEEPNPEGRVEEKIMLEKIMWKM